MRSLDGRRDGRPRWLLAVATVALVVVVMFSIGFIAGRVPSAAPVVTAEGTPAVPAQPIPPLLTPSSQTNLPVHEVPASIDSTGETDVTDDLEAFIQSVPDGSLIRMQAGGLYRVEGTLDLIGRSSIELDGAGATIQATEFVDTNRRNISIVESSWISIHDLTIRGVHPEPGVLDRDHQFEHGIWIDGGSDIEISDVTILNPYGDCIYLGLGDGSLAWVQRVIIRDIVCQGAGRNGVAIVGGEQIRIEGSTFERIGLHAVDIEPNRTDGRGGTEPVLPVQGARDVAVIGNRIVGPIEGYFFAANGWGAIDGLSVIDNVLEGTPLRITVQPLPDSRFIRTGILVEGNRSDTPFETIDGAAMRFTRATDLTVRKNVGPLSGGAGSLVEIRETCRVDIGDNEFPGGEREVLGAAGSCPVATAPQLRSP